MSYFNNGRSRSRNGSFDSSNDDQRSGRYGNESRKVSGRTGNGTPYPLKYEYNESPEVMYNISNNLYELYINFCFNIFY